MVIGSRWRTPKDCSRAYHTYPCDKFCCHPHDIAGETSILPKIPVVNLGCQAFTQVLFDLAANPSFVPALRGEVETLIKEEGYTKMSLHKMVKLDSFIKESQRLGVNNARMFRIFDLIVSSSNSFHSVIMQRKVLKDFTFSDGTVVPKGNIIVVPNFAMHYDEVPRPILHLRNDAEALPLHRTIMWIPQSSMGSDFPV